MPSLLSSFGVSFLYLQDFFHTRAVSTNITLNQNTWLLKLPQSIELRLFFSCPNKSFRARISSGHCCDVEFSVETLVVHLELTDNWPKIAAAAKATSYSLWIRKNEVRFNLSFESFCFTCNWGIRGRRLFYISLSTSTYIT